MSPTATTARITIEPRFNGPLTSANGGYACGRVARFVAERLEPIELGTPVVAVGWSLGGEGRKLVSASALLAADARILARARALWIQLRPPTG